MIDGALAWVVGRGGLLGSAIERALRARGVQIHVPAHPFDWTDDALEAQVASACATFARVAADAGAWTVWWAAGVGTFASDDSALQPETRALETVLAGLTGLVHGGVGGTLAFASSAGALYAGSRVDVVTEDTPPNATTAYGRAKLVQESLVREFGDATGTKALIARFSTLYGANQSSRKGQGLLTHIARSIVRHQPISIFVPLDTIRDYLAVDDAATFVIDALDDIGDGTSVRIVASEHPTTIAEIAHEFRRIARQPVRFVTSATPASLQYTRRIEFRSLWPRRATLGTPLQVGIHQLLERERLRHASGSD